MAAASRRWGWHRLDARWACWLVEQADLPARALVLDVGAGTGALTAPLLGAGATVVAVEAHPGRARSLRDRFGDAVVVVTADAADLRLPRRPYHVVANPPFSVTGPLLRRLLQPGSRLQSARLVLQDGAARRWAGPAAAGAARWGREFTVGLGPPLPRSAFHPRPGVDVRVLVIERRAGRL